MIPQQSIDQINQNRGDLLADAAQGRQLMTQLSAKWYEQGYNAGKMGIAHDDAGLFSPEHRRGYMAAALGAVPQFVNVAGLPALSRQAKTTAAMIALLLALVLSLAPADAQAGGSGITVIRRRIVKAPVVRIIRTAAR